ncbi:MAG: tetratricopeptide repeat protein [Calditrichaeota bacterium]|nr:MAG: tetratricopeptide repeat protein [Calditrichota bacterium]
MSRKVTLSLCMIVKNEAAYLADCLASVAGVVDEIVVVDTGSVDGTVELAKQWGARVAFFPWRDDFAAARNQSLRLARGEWILYLDADERLHPEAEPEIRKVMRDERAAFVSVLIDSKAAAGGAEGHLTRSHRLFRNLPGVRFTGRIHEQVSPFFLGLGHKEYMSNIRLVHLGYAKTEAELAEKRRRNRRLLAKQLQEEPNNAFWHYSLAQNLMLSQEFETAGKALEQALRLGQLPSDIVAAALNNLAEVYLRMKQHDKAIECAHKAIEMEPGQTLGHLMLYQIYRDLGERTKQIESLEAVVGLQQGRARIARSVAVDAWVKLERLHVNLGRLYLEEGRIDEARTHFEEALVANNTYLPALRALADCLLSVGDYPRALAVLERTAQQSPHDPATLDRLGLAALKLGDFRKAIFAYRKLEEHDPSNTAVKRRLAALYHKVGEPDKSRAYLRRV